MVRVVSVQPEHYGDTRKEEVKKKRYRLLLDVLEKVEGDIFVFPELFLGGYAEEKSGEILKIAEERSLAVLTGGVRRENGKLYNTLFLFDESGVQHFHKVNLWKEETKFFARGEGYRIYTLRAAGKKINVLPFICSDFCSPNYLKDFGKPLNVGALKEHADKADFVAVPSWAWVNGLFGWFECLRDAAELSRKPVVFSNYGSVLLVDGDAYGGGNSAIFLPGNTSPILVVPRGKRDFFTVSFDLDV